MEDIKNNERNDGTLKEDPIWKTFDALPESIKDVLVDPAFENNVENIAKQHGMTEKFPDILRISEEVLLGILPIRRFVQTLAEEASIPQEQAQKIGYEIRDRVFADVADDLSRLHKAGSPPRSLDGARDKRP